MLLSHDIHHMQRVQHHLLATVAVVGETNRPAQRVGRELRGAGQRFIAQTAFEAKLEERLKHP